MTSTFSPGAQLGRGLQIFSQLQTNQANIAAQREQQRLRNLKFQEDLRQQGLAEKRQQELVGLAQQLGPQPTPGGLPRSQAFAQLAVQFPDEFEQINKNLGLITDRQKQEAADFAFTALNTPPERRSQLIEQRVRSLEAQGRDASNTRELLTLNPEQQDEFLQVAQVAVLPLDERVKLARGEPLQAITRVEGGFEAIRGQEAVFIPSATARKTEKQISADLKREEDRVKRETVQAKTVFDQSSKLRQEISKVSSTFKAVEDASARIKASAKDPSAAGDLALIFSFMRMQDPTSTVREGEFATAQNATGVPERVRNIWNRVLAGERLGDEQRKDFLNTADKLFKEAKDINEKRVNTIIDIGDQLGIEKSLLVGREEEEQQDLTQLSDEELLRQLEAARGAGQ